MSINLKTLITKLNDTCRLATERAANICISRGHYEVDIEHLFLALLEQDKSDISLILRRNNIDPRQLAADLQAETEQFQSGNSRTPVFSPNLSKLFEHAWLIASLDNASASVRSGQLLLALLTAPDLQQLAWRSSKLFSRIALDALKHDLPALTTGSQETTVNDTAASADAEIVSQPAAGKTPALDQYTTNLTQRAREGKLDPVIGRDAEIRQAIDILLRRRQNNPILTGEPGVGKTAVVEGLALRIAAHDVPEVLDNVELHTLDMGLLQAGASVKGEFENRLKSVIDEVKKSPRPIILFIDEAHTLIGAGGQAGQNDAANLLKPALARGELRTIAATTWSEYKTYFEKDAALARRFQVVKIEEPDEATACAMLRGMLPHMEQHFNVRIQDQAIIDAVRLSHRYISGRQLPDKAISVLDTACAKVALAQNATPAPLETVTKRLEHLAAEISQLSRETRTSGQHQVRLDACIAQRDSLLAEQAALAQRWHEERALSQQIQALRGQLETGEHAPTAQQQSELAALTQQLQQLQGEIPLTAVQVDGHTVAQVISSWTGIPLGNMLKDDLQQVLDLPARLHKRIIGQRHAIATLAQRIRTSRAGLDDPNKPQGVFLFAGTSGVGKTETALALADALYGGEHKLITINLSEYQEAHSVSGLKGSPPGYVGYGTGGILTEAVRRNPYSVVLLDEAEKAHPDVLELFFQVFDKGRMEDAEGREIDFRNTFIILTSNVGASSLMQACLNKTAKELPSVDELDNLIRPQLVKVFKPAFLGRLQVIPFYPIDDIDLAEIIRLKLQRVVDRIATQHQIRLDYSESVIDTVLNRCTEVDSGARNVDSILNGSLLPELAQHLLTHMAEGKQIDRIKVSSLKSGQFKYQMSGV
ncbi:type VI secretion system ATPase TssH [Sulfuriferula nivalis]|uniref:Protease associated ATPase ClpB n=1 Tax=Sulfuriferula nivalis TaxID=2675298 RepID=A0A809SA00_9PROT|nr:type VI secretion system ATPase TssH [Sulfuriferula nivalis]BBP01643.1 protease associated ATPase ClpB [Sulfuriferula nivalis]